MSHHIVLPKAKRKHHSSGAERSDVTSVSMFSASSGTSSKTSKPTPKEAQPARKVEVRITDAGEQHVLPVLLPLYASAQDLFDMLDIKNLLPPPETKSGQNSRFFYKITRQAQPDRPSVSQLANVRIESWPLTVGEEDDFESEPMVIGHRTPLKDFCRALAKKMNPNAAAAEANTKTGATICNGTVAWNFDGNAELGITFHQTVGCHMHGIA